MKYDVHVCLVSDQPIPNLIPIFEGETRPAQVILLVSNDKKSQGTWLKGVIEDAGCSVTVEEIHPYSLERAYTTVVNLVDSLSGINVALNATGGTKIMSLAAFEAFRYGEKPVFYVDTENRKIINLYPPRDPVPAPNVLKVEPYLKSYGYAVLSEGRSNVRPPDVGGIAEIIIAEPNKWANAVRALNSIATNAQTSLRGPVSSKTRSEVPCFSELVEIFEAIGLVEDDGNQLIFPDEESRLYVNGGWLEEHVISVLRELQKDLEIVDLQNNLQVRKAPSGPQNELDVVFTSWNRLHLVECKTGSVGAEVTYKIETLKNVTGGTFGRAILISFHSLRAEHKQRCADLRIECVDGSSIRHLKDSLIRWVRGR